MQRVGVLRGSLLVAVILAAALTATILATRSSGAGNGRSRAVVRTMHNAALGRTILVTRGGLTLYSLSAERHGRFICTTAACLSLWKPLVVPAGTKPTGAARLATVKRPDGRRQVAYRGAPLYRFVQDTKPGEARGNGFRDVGVWRPATVGKKAPSVSKAPAPSNSSPYGY